jgi:hypothetical protein
MMWGKHLVERKRGEGCFFRLGEFVKGAKGRFFL